MQKKAKIQNKIYIYKDDKFEFSYYIDKAKSCYITIKNQQVVVKVPRSTSDIWIKKLLKDKSSWIAKKLEESKERQELPKQYCEGEIFKILGKNYSLHIEYSREVNEEIFLKDDKIHILLPKKEIDLNNTLYNSTFSYNEKINSNNVLDNSIFNQNEINGTLNKKLNINPQEKIKSLIERFYNQILLIEVQQAMEKWISKTGLKPNLYRIRNLKSSWGNCSSTKNISISKKLATYSKHAIEYVCLHEICHLKHMNHSKEFWDLVYLHMNDYKLAEKELKNK